LNRIERLEEQLAPLRHDLINHRIYEEMDRLDALQTFMQHHVFAVWDFMSLLKALQRKICCVDVPWVPPADPQACRLINEIVLAEESDSVNETEYSSHFDLYHRSMQQCGSSTVAIDSFISQLRQGVPVRTALASQMIPQSARAFVEHTFSIIESGNTCAIATAFTFGREDLLPDVFQRIVEKLNREYYGQLSEFDYYLQRHIGLDADEHGPIARRLVESLCGTDESNWRVAEETAISCLIARRKLWDGIYSQRYVEQPVNQGS
jgi:hypothetical protein